ncbi:hypothetical protein FACS1894111_04660 [Clostridia bacterium]|nr:hypothetical protein FACS1894111_04660 [Clostridia bacterium]
MSIVFMTFLYCNTHSVFIEILFMSGLVGLFLYIRLFIALIKTLNMIRENRVYPVRLRSLVGDESESSHRAGD